MTDGFRASYRYGNRWCEGIKLYIGFNIKEQRSGTKKGARQSKSVDGVPDLQKGKTGWITFEWEAEKNKFEALNDAR